MSEISDRRRVHLLVVEDNPGDVAILQYALNNADVDCDLTVIDNGRDALELLRGSGRYASIPTPDLAILDLNLPKHDGFEILQAMRSSRVFAGLPVAVISSSPMMRDQARIETFQVSRYITKPPDLDEYLQIGFVIREMLDQRQCTAQVQRSEKETIPIQL